MDAVETFAETIQLRRTLALTPALTLSPLSPDGGEGISRASSLLLIAIRSLGSRFSCERQVYSISHRGIHLDQRAEQIIVPHDRTGMEN